ncbi:hypothetical protein [Synechocystis sp. LKSZ1]|uniref:hypothetical protein n=1 Tax=Synechocystis sp. LKSZ1 TaxID=3144951 RepID=UPI00336BE172
MTIPPPLYLFDPDQTHDLLWAERIDGNIATLLSNSFQNHGPLDASSLPVVLVDRYIPGGDSIPWASEWTTTYYEFLKPLSRTHLLTDGEINGSAYGFEPEYQANLPSSLNLGAAWPEKVKVKVTKGQTGLISWLERAHSECHAGQYCPQVNNDIQVWTRRHKVITAFVEDLETELDCRLWLHNSVVVQNASLEGLSDAQKRLFRYADLDDVLEDCYSQFRISEPKALTAFDVTLISTYSTSYAFPGGLSHTLNYSSPLFQALPSQYYYAALIYAEKSQRASLGKPVTVIANVAENPGADQPPYVFSVSLTWSKLDNLLPENAVQVPWGLDIANGSHSPVLTVPLANNNTDINGSLSTFTGNHNPSLAMPRLTVVSDRPVVDTIAELPTKASYNSVWVYETDCFYRYLNNEPDESLLNGLDVIPHTGANKWWYRAEHTASFPIGQYAAADNSASIAASNSGAKRGNTFFFELDVPEGTPKGDQPNEAQTRPFPYSIYYTNCCELTQLNGYFYSGKDNEELNKGEIKLDEEYFKYAFSPRFVNLNCLSIAHVELFSSGTANLLFRHDLEYTLRRRTRLQGDGNYGAAPDTWGESYGGGSTSREEYSFYEVVNQLSININFPSSFNTDTLTITALPGSNGSQLKFSDSGPLPQGYYEIFRPEGQLTGTIGSTQRATRTLRVQPLTKPLYVIEQGSQTLFPTEAQFLKLIEPKPGFFICDPDPDPLQNCNIDPQPNNPNNTEWIGDIMPDSLRVKEIHAALQADKYANDDFDTQKARVANLGWLIDKMSNVLGLHFASDGEMLKVRDTEHKKDGEVIPEQWQIGQWGKNNWIAKKFNGQKVAVNGVGYAYEVRSNGFGTDKFTGANTSIEEGGWVLVNSLIQLLEVKYDDDDRAFGLQDLGANVIPRADKTGYIAYEGMHSLLIEIAYMLSSLSGNISRSEVLNMKSVAILQELLASQGLPVELKTMPATVAGQSVQIPYPGLSSDSPSLVDFMFWILSNLAPVVSAQLAYKQDETEKL